MKYQEALNRISKYCGLSSGSILENDRFILLPVKL